MPGRARTVVEVRYLASDVRFGPSLRLDRGDVRSAPEQRSRRSRTDPDRSPDVRVPDGRSPCVHNTVGIRGKSERPAIVEGGFYADGCEGLVRGSGQVRPVRHIADGNLCPESSQRLGGFAVADKSADFPSTLGQRGDNRPSKGCIIGRKLSAISRQHYAAPLL